MFNKLPDITNQTKSAKMRILELTEALPRKVVKGEDCVVFPFKAGIDEFGVVFSAFKAFFNEQQGQDGVTGSFLYGNAVNIPLNHLKNMTENDAVQFLELCNAQLLKPMSRKIYIKRLKALTGVNINYSWPQKDVREGGYEISYKMEGGTAFGCALDPIRNLPAALNKAIGEELFTGFIRGDLSHTPYFNVFITEGNFDRLMQNEKLTNIITVFHAPRESGQSYRNSGGVKSKLAALADLAFGGERSEHSNYNYNRSNELNSDLRDLNGTSLLRPPQSNDETPVLGM